MAWKANPLSFQKPSRRFNLNPNPSINRPFAILAKHEDIQRFNLFWLCHAMTAPLRAEETYYFDGQTKRFFTASHSGLLDMLDLPLPELLMDDIRNRLTDIETEAPQFAAISRLNVQDKIATRIITVN